MTRDNAKERMDAINKSEVEILVVEDSPTQALYLEKVLREHGFEVSVTLNGEEALKQLKKKIPTLVLSDVLMPGIDGYELCRRIKEDKQYEGIPVILLTALSDPVDILKGLDCGADNFIIKPFEKGSLISRINYVLVNATLRSKSAAGLGIEIFFAGRKHFLTAERIQIIDLLISSFEAAVSSSLELEKTNAELTSLTERLTREIEERIRAEEEREKLILELKEALSQVKKLSGLLPICASCKKVRDDKGYWQQIEGYIRDHSEADFSHGICPECAKRLYPEYTGDK